MPTLSKSRRGHFGKGSKMKVYHTTGNEPEYEPWVPIDDKTDLKHGLKGIEEFGELISAMARCLMQGIDEVEPVTKKSNRLWLNEEMADAQLLMDMIGNRFNLDYRFMQKRQDSKRKRLINWLFPIAKE